MKYAEPHEALTDWLPWVAPRAGGDASWWAPEVGELAQAVVLAVVYSDAHPAPASSSAPSPDKHLTRYADGAVVEYDRAAHKLWAALPAGGAVEITAPEGVKVIGKLTVEGDVESTGNITADGNVEADGDMEAGGGVKAGSNVEDRQGTMAAMRTTYNTHTHGVPPGVVTPPPNQRMT